MATTVETGSVNAKSQWDRVAEMDPIVAKAVAAMRNEGVVP